MDITMRGLQGGIFRKFKAKAAEEKIKLGDALSQAMNLWLKKERKKSKAKLSDLKITNWGPGTENSSEEVDTIVYGAEVH